MQLPGQIRANNGERERCAQSSQDLADHMNMNVCMGVASDNSRRFVVSDIVVSQLWMMQPLWTTEAVWRHFRLVFVVVHIPSMHQLLHLYWIWLQLCLPLVPHEWFAGSSITPLLTQRWVGTDFIFLFEWTVPLAILLNSKPGYFQKSERNSSSYGSWYRRDHDTFLLL